MEKNGCCGVFLGQSARWAWDASISRALVAIAPGDGIFRALVGHDMSTMAFGWTLTFSTVVQSV